MKVYISGAITSIDSYAEAQKNFEEVEKKLRKIGVTDIFNPIKEVPQSLKWTQQMDICLLELAKCDVVVFQKNWKESIGARWEFVEAQRLNIHIRFDEPNDYVDLKHRVEGLYKPINELVK